MINSPDYQFRFIWAFVSSDDQLLLQHPTTHGTISLPELVRKMKRTAL